MSLSSQSIRNILEIKDPNIIFSEDSYFEQLKGHESLVIPAVLSYTPKRCLHCGFKQQIVKNGFNTNLIIVPSLVQRPTFLKLKRQRFKCLACATTFDAQTNYIWENCQIAQPVRQLILRDTASNQSNKDIAARYHVSDKTVQRVIDAEAQSHTQAPKDSLPKHLAFDEFKSTGNQMSFIWCDAARHALGDILYYRTSAYLKQYFLGFSLATRKKVKTISLDLNAGYINLIPDLFPNAKVIVDRFHIVQMLNRSLNQIRIQVMKTLDKKNKKYRFMKREWKQFLRPIEKLEATKPTYHQSVGYYETTLNLVTECLDLDPKFQAAYDTYQACLKALHTKDTQAFATVLHTYRCSDKDNPLDKTISSFRKYRRQVLNAVDSIYSNGFLEGTISRIKKIKNTAYGFRNWENFIARIKLQLEWLHPVRSVKAA